jgi:hypothetical protein
VMSKITVANPVTSTAIELPAPEAVIDPVVAGGSDSEYCSESTVTEFWVYEIDGRFWLPGRSIELEAI